jgi:hypothetical protein
VPWHTPPEVAIAKRVIPIIVALALLVFAFYQVGAQAQVVCTVCVKFKSRRECATASGTEEDRAREEAQGSACSRMTSGISDAVACPRVTPDSVSCKAR